MAVAEKGKKGDIYNLADSGETSELLPPFMSPLLLLLIFFFFFFFSFCTSS